MVAVRQAVDFITSAMMWVAHPAPSLIKCGSNVRRVTRLEPTLQLANRSPAYELVTMFSDKEQLVRRLTSCLRLYPILAHLLLLYGPVWARQPSVMLSGRRG